VTEHIIRDHSEALTRKWLDSKYQETFYPPMEGVTEPADEGATGRIEELEEELQEMSEKNTFIEEEVAGKLDQLTVVSEENVVLKAEVAEMLNQITQFKKVSDENAVLKTEAAEMLNQITQLKKVSDENAILKAEAAEMLNQITQLKKVSDENAVLKAEAAEMLNQITQLKKVSDENAVLKAEENALLEAEVVEKSNQIRGLTAELADAKKALVAREQAEEARENWWLYKAFEKDAKGGETNVGPDASGMEVLEEAKEVDTNKQIEGKQTKKKGEKKKIECKKCGYQAKIPFFLAKHMERKHSANIFSCDKCMFTSTSEYWFKQHAKAHNGKEINCDVCKKCFSSTRNLKAHKDGVHGLPKL